MTVSIVKRRLNVLIKKTVKHISDRLDQACKPCLMATEACVNECIDFCVEGLGEDCLIDFIDAVGELDLETVYAMTIKVIDELVEGIAEMKVFNQSLDCVSNFKPAIYVAVIGASTATLLWSAQLLISLASLIGFIITTILNIVVIMIATAKSVVFISSMTVAWVATITILHDEVHSLNSVA